MSYKEYLLSNHWKNLKIQAFALHGNYCCVCGWKENLQVHHLWYSENYDWKSCNVIQLRVLCDACHCRYHEKNKNLFTNPKEALFNFETFRRKSGAFIRKEERRLETEEEYKNRIKKEKYGIFETKSIESFPKSWENDLKPIIINTKYTKIIHDFIPKQKKLKEINKPPKSQITKNKKLNNKFKIGPWTKEETDFIIKYGNKLYNQELSRKLNRSIIDIKVRGREINIIIDKPYPYYIKKDSC